MFKSKATIKWLFKYDFAVPNPQKWNKWFKRLFMELLSSFNLFALESQQTKKLLICLLRSFGRLKGGVFSTLIVNFLWTSNWNIPNIFWPCWHSNIWNRTLKLQGQCNFKMESFSVLRNFPQTPLHRAHWRRFTSVENFFNIWPWHPGKPWGFKQAQNLVISC